jgi:molecular chaperone GrpE
MRQFGESLSKLGIERVESVGKPFDPTVHESIQFEHHEAFAAGLVAKELQAGYRQGDSLLRPALVVVSKGPTPSNEPSNDPSNEPSKEPSKEPSEAPSDAASASDEPSKPAANESGGEQATDGDS